MNWILKAEGGKGFGDVPVLPLGKMDLAVADVFLPVQLGLLYTAGIAFFHGGQEERHWQQHQQQLDCSQQLQVGSTICKEAL